MFPRNPRKSNHPDEKNNSRVDLEGRGSQREGVGPPVPPAIGGTAPNSLEFSKYVFFP